MAFIGKLLVVLHSALSLGVLAWAVAVYTQRIDWNTPKVDAGKEVQPGLFDRQKALAVQYNGAVDKAYTRWSGNLFQVQALEAERYPRREFYKNELDTIRTGKTTANNKTVVVSDPVRELVYGSNGFINIKSPSRPPVMVRPGIKADSIAGYNTKMVKLVEDIQASQVKNAKAIIERDRLNDDIIGHKQPMLKKGLRTLLLEQVTFKERAQREDEYIVDFITNREADFGLLKKRRDAMLGRIDELNKWKIEPHKDGNGRRLRLRLTRPKGPVYPAASGKTL